MILKVSFFLRVQVPPVLHSIKIDKYLDNQKVLNKKLGLGFT
jgi:hypothetical protein